MILSDSAVNDSYGRQTCPVLSDPVTCPSFDLRASVHLPPPGFAASLRDCPPRGVFGLFHFWFFFLVCCRRALCLRLSISVEGADFGPFPSVFVDPFRTGCSSGSSFHRQVVIAILLHVGDTVLWSIRAETPLHLFCPPLWTSASGFYFFYVVLGSDLP